MQSNPFSCWNVCLLSPLAILIHMTDLMHAFFLCPTWFCCRLILFAVCNTFVDLSFSHLLHLYFVSFLSLHLYRVPNLLTVSWWFLRPPPTLQHFVGAFRKVVAGCIFSASLCQFQRQGQLWTQVVGQLPAAPQTTSSNRMLQVYFQQLFVLLLSSQLVPLTRHLAFQSRAQIVVNFPWCSPFKCMHRDLIFVLIYQTLYCLEFLQCFLPLLQIRNY